MDKSNCLNLVGINRNKYVKFEMRIEKKELYMEKVM